MSSRMFFVSQYLKPIHLLKERNYFSLVDILSFDLLLRSIKEKLLIFMSSEQSIKWLKISKQWKSETFLVNL